MAQPNVLPPGIAHTAVTGEAVVAGRRLTAARPRTMLRRE